MTVATGPMEPEALLQILSSMGCNRSALGRRLGKGSYFFPDMLKGQRKVPKQLAAWLRTMQTLHQMYPFPRIQRSDELGTMTGDELRRIMASLCWRAKAVEVRYGLTTEASLKMVAGKRRIPEVMAASIREFAYYFEANPPPGGWVS